MEIEPKDIIVQLYPHKMTGWGVGSPKGISIYHKPSDLTITIDKHRSQHKNKNEALIILEDFVTPFSISDIIVSEYGIGEISQIDENHGCCFVLEDGTGRYSSFEEISHTEEGFKYKMVTIREYKIEKLQEEITTSQQ